MADGYLKGLGNNLVVSAAWVFTVGGAVASLAVGKEYTWIAGLFLAAGIIALITHGWQTHQQHQKERAELREKLQAEVQRREEAERRLAEVPAEALARIATLVTEGTVNELVKLLTQRADLAGRLRNFTAAQTKPLAVRAFQRIQGVLFVVVRGIELALPHLRPGDPFVLLRKNEVGVEITAARLSVHQPIEAGKDVVIFRVEAAMSDDIAHLTGLAGERSVEGIKGYIVAPGFDLATVPTLDFAQVALAIPHLAANLSQPRGG